ncbi:MAG TPA: hypothetical protein PKA12_12565 [Saprospiraceae bacterium]|nr:hypothetical protein [Saprospiraceae bacterium]
MKRFLIKVVFFVTLWLFLIGSAIFFSHLWVKRQKFTNANTEGNLLIMPNGNGVDYLVLGISHGRNLSRRSHHELFESVFNATMVNLSQGESLGGLENQHLFLRTFYEKGNKTNDLILVLSPSLMFNADTDQSDIMLYREPLELAMMNRLIEMGNKRKWHQLFFYIKSKLGHHWWMLKPDNKTHFDGVLTAIDAEAMKEGFQLAYPKGLDLKTFQNRCQELAQLVNTAETNGARLTFVIPPAAFGFWPGHGAVLAHLKRQYPGRRILDHSEAVIGNAFYYDHHHLNTEGMKKYLALLYSGMVRKG